MKIAFAASPIPQAQKSCEELTKRYNAVAPDDADVVVVLGGDGHVLKTLYETLKCPKPVYAMRRTKSVGFLCNDYNTDDLIERIETAQSATLNPLQVSCQHTDGRKSSTIAINEVTLLRDSPQSAKLRVCVDDIERISTYSGDGLLVSTPAGSTAYNYSAGGPIMPLDSGTLVMTAICGFRPRRWTCAILPQDVTIDIKVIETRKRPVRVEADFASLHDITSVRMRLDEKCSFTLLFDPDQHLGERIIREQFMT